MGGQLNEPFQLVCQRPLGPQAARLVPLADGAHTIRLAALKVLHLVELVAVLAVGFTRVDGRYRVAVL